MPTLADLLPLDEFDPKTAQVLLGDSPAFRNMQADIVAMLKARIQVRGRGNDRTAPRARRGLPPRPSVVWWLGTRAPD
jgi:hypothetical protein